LADDEATMASLVAHSAARAPSLPATFTQMSFIRFQIGCMIFRVRALAAALLCCALLSGCGWAYTRLRSAVERQLFCLSGLLSRPEESCWGTHLVGDATWGGGWP
jgi:hypothetical protein